MKKSRPNTSSDLRKPLRGFLIAQSSSRCQEPFVKNSGSLTNRATHYFERPQRYCGSFFLLLIVSIFLLVSPALALDPLVPFCGTSASPEPCTTCDALVLGKNISDFILFYLVPALASTFFIYAGFTILLGGGIPAQVAKGQNIFRTTVYGLLIIFLAWLMVNTVLRTVADDRNIAENWWKLECRETISSTTPTPTPTQTPIQTDTPTLTPTPTPTETPNLTLTPTLIPTPTPIVNPTALICPDSGVNLCQESGSCPVNACSQYARFIQNATAGTSISGLNTAALVKAIMFNESSCNIDAINNSVNPPSCGLMQLQPATANRFKSLCGVTANITCDWLISSANTQANICIAAKYLKSIAAGTCGTSVRNIAAGYNGGIGACSASRDCAGEKSCSNERVRRWECLYDNPQHTVCNSGYDETRNYAPKVLACYNINK